MLNRFHGLKFIHMLNPKGFIFGNEKDNHVLMVTVIAASKEQALKIA